jgi:hypothetical protein
MMLMVRHQQQLVAFWIVLAAAAVAKGQELEHLRMKRTTQTRWLLEGVMCCMQGCLACVELSASCNTWSPKFESEIATAQWDMCCLKMALKAKAVSRLNVVSITLHQRKITIPRNMQAVTCTIYKSASKALIHVGIDYHMMITSFPLLQYSQGTCN